MIIELDRTGTVDGLRQILERTAAQAAVRSLLILAADANGFTPEQVDPILTALPLPLFGGIFPEIIHGREHLGTGTLVIGLPHPTHVEVIPGLSDDRADYERLIDDELSGHPRGNTMFVLVDGFAKRIAALIESLFSVFGHELDYIGGGAGSLGSLVDGPKPCLLTNRGLVFDCAVLALSSIPIGVGVNHGWTEVSGPHQVTRSRGNVIEELDRAPALDVYRKVVEARTGRPLTAEGFFELAKGFPFGISKLGEEKIVRDPISRTADGSLVCVGEVPQGCFVHILEGDADTLVAAARKALELARAAYAGPGEPRATLFIDCVSRRLALGDDFGRELDAVADPSIPLVGALTLGEIANSGKDYLEFYNKTSVVGVLG
jgi:hypothetical protein